MIHVTITDLETNEVKLDKDVNAVIVGTSSEGDNAAAAVIGSIKDLAFAYNVLREAVYELANDNPEFWPIYDFIKAMQAVEGKDDADE